MIWYNVNVNLVLLQIGSIPLGSELPIAAAIIFNRLIRDQLPSVKRFPIMYNNKEEMYHVFKVGQNKLRTMITSKNLFLSIQGLQ